MNKFPLTTRNILDCLSCLDNIYVCSAETLPKTIKNGDIIVSNLSYLFEEGSHWILLTKKGDEIILFDSLALNIIRPDHVKFIKLNCKKLLLCKKRIQSFDSFYCGHYVVLCAYFLKAGGNCEDFVAKFQSNYVKNDDSALAQLSDLFGDLTNRKQAGQRCIALKSKSHALKLLLLFCIREEKQLLSFLSSLYS
jgi:hypothetical protein